MGISRGLRHRLRQGAVRRRLHHPDHGHRLHQRERLRQGGRAAPWPASCARWASSILATRGTAEFLSAHGVPAEMVYKVNEGRPNCVDLIKSGKIDIIFNTPLGRESFYDDGAIRKSATLHGVLVVTTLTAAAATVQAIQALRERAAGRREPAGDPRAAPASSARARGEAPLPRAQRRAARTPPRTRACCARSTARASRWPGIAGRQRRRAGGRGLGRAAPTSTSWSSRPRGLHPWMWVRGWGGGLLSGTPPGRDDRRVPARARPSRGCGCRARAGHRRGHRRAGGLPRGQPARRGARLLQLPRRLPAHGPRAAGGSTTAASPRSSRCAWRARWRARAGVVVAVDCNSGHALAGAPTPSWPWPCAPASRCCAAARAASWPGADLVIAPSMGESGWMRPAQDPAASSPPATRRLRRGAARAAPAASAA